MEQEFYRAVLAGRFGLEVLVPDEAGIAAVNDIIYDELCQGRIEDASRRRLVEVIDGLVERGAQGVVLGCTELPLLVRQADVEIPLFDTSRLHAAAAVDMALD
jgi:aspartate racemase